jgi:hypothetical protein
VSADEYATQGLILLQNAGDAIATEAFGMGFAFSELEFFQRINVRLGFRPDHWRLVRERQSFSQAR